MLAAPCNRKLFMPARRSVDLNSMRDLSILPLSNTISNAILHDRTPRCYLRPAEYLSGHQRLAAEDSAEVVLVGITSSLSGGN